MISREYKTEEHLLKIPCDIAPWHWVAAHALLTILYQVHLSHGTKPGNHLGLSRGYPSICHAAQSQEATLA